MHSRSYRQVLVVTAALLALVPLSAALASPANGELCSIQSTDQSVRISVYSYSPVAGEAQVAAAGAWCTDEVTAHGWLPASKFYDSFRGQVEVCGVHNQGSVLAFSVSAFDNALDSAAQSCTGIALHPDSVIWYP
jgi:hypothetical protein